jgi:hypothetical protein
MIAFVTLILVACEARLELEGVTQNQHEAIQRSDQFQAAAATTNSIVVVGNQGLILISDI